MNNTDKMASLLGFLRKQTNGEVVDSMRKKGIEWPLSYGASLSAIRCASAHYAPDHQFARLLYQQQVRELRLAALTVADPAQITAGELWFWASGVTNEEVAEHLSVLLSHSDVVEPMAAKWLLPASGRWLNYCALLTISRQIQTARSAARHDATILLARIDSLLPSGDSFTWRASATLINALYRFAPTMRGQIEEYASTLEESSQPGAKYLESELFLESRG